MGRGGGMAVPFYDMAASGVSQLETASWSQPAGVGTPFLRCRVFVLTWILESRAFPCSSTFNIPLVFPTKIYIAYSPPHTLQEVKAQEHSKAKKRTGNPRRAFAAIPAEGKSRTKRPSHLALDQPQVGLSDQGKHQPALRRQNSSNR